MTGKENESILQLENIVKLYRTKTSFFGGGTADVIALNQVSLKIREGEIFGLVGESGSGKTTVGRLIVGLEDPTYGNIFLNGNEITGLKGKEKRAFSRKVQMIFQDPYQSLNPQLSVVDTVSEPLIIHKLGDAHARQGAVWEALRAVGLSPPEDFAYRYPHQLSGGQRQRVAIARAMVLNPKFVVADEPTSMLDASISAQIFNILLEMRDKLRVTQLFITHSLAAARYLCDRIAVIYRGNLMEFGTAEDIIQNPKHPYTQALLDAIPKFGQCGEVKQYGTLLEQGRVDFENIGCPFFPRCKLAHRLKCSQEIPLLTPIDDTHKVACFYAKPGADEGEAGKACHIGI